MVTAEELSNRFTYHPPTDDDNRRHRNIRVFCLGLAKFIVDTTPASREQSLALAHIEEAMFWANAAIARNSQEE